MLKAEYERGYEDARAAQSAAFPIPLLHRVAWNRDEVIGVVRPGWEWVAEKASRQNIADHETTEAYFGKRDE